MKGRFDFPSTKEDKVEKSERKKDKKSGKERLILLLNFNLSASRYTGEKSVNFANLPVTPWRQA